MIDLDWIRALIRMVEESDVDTVEISRLTTRVRVSKSPPVAAGSVAAPAAGAATSAPAPSPGTPATGEGAATAEAAPEEGEPEAAAHLHAVESPMVGTFYRAPAPDAPPYVEVGERVEKGQTLCILEAMKLMNELESEVAGTIAEICVDNAQPVEYGQVLFRVDASA